MLAIAFTFPAGRYHATPWGRHVNEAAVSWPPDAWRLARALIATWHRKLDPTRHPRNDLRDLLAALFREPPRYRLPEGVHAHTRHYMPTRGKPTLVFDAFARVLPDDPLIVFWPDLTLNDEKLALLDTLLDALGYLGRAESWAAARRMEAAAVAADCFPGEKAMDPNTGEVLGELVQLYVPATSEEYDAFRARTLAALGGNKKVAATLPEDWLDALSLDTADLQKAGWNRPPAVRVVSYVRPLESLKIQATPRPARRPPDAATTARYALYGKPLPRLEDAVRVGEILRWAIMGQARRLKMQRIPMELSGHDLPEGNRHGHAFYLPEDADGDGQVDHLIVHAPDGLSPAARQILDELAWVREREGGEWRLMLEGIGKAETLAAASPLLGKVREWVSVTPYLHPWHVKRGFAVSDQMRKECRLRQLPEPTVEVLGAVRVGNAQRRPIHFHRFRRKRGLIQPDTGGRFLRLRFPEPVSGPLALGFGCHFGLGLFRPATSA